MLFFIQNWEKSNPLQHLAYCRVLVALGAIGFHIRRMRLALELNIYMRSEWKSSRPFMTLLCTFSFEQVKPIPSCPTKGCNCRKVYLEEAFTCEDEPILLHTICWSRVDSGGSNEPPFDIKLFHSHGEI